MLEDITHPTVVTLYDLIASIDDEIGTGEEPLLIETVMKLIRTRQIKWLSPRRKKGSADFLAHPASPWLH